MENNSERKKKDDVVKKRSPHVEKSRASSASEKSRSKRQRSSSAVSTTKSANNSAVEKATDVVKEPKEKKSKFRLPAAIQPNVVAVIISLVLQAIVTFYILGLLLTASGVNIIYMIIFVLMNITAVFFTVEVIISKEKYFVLLSLIDSLLVAGGAILVLVLLIKFSETEVTGVLHIAGVTIVVQVCNVLALAHHSYVKYLRKDKKETEARCSCRQAAGGVPDSEDPPARSPSPAKRSPPQNFYTEDCGHTPISKGISPESSNVDAEIERSSVKTKVTWFDTVEVATTPKGSRPMRYLVEV